MKELYYVTQQLSVVFLWKPTKNYLWSLAGGYGYLPKTAGPKLVQVIEVSLTTKENKANIVFV